MLGPELGEGHQRLREMQSLASWRAQSSGAGRQGELYKQLSAVLEDVQGTAKVWRKGTNSS